MAQGGHRALPFGENGMGKGKQQNVRGGADAARSIRASHGPCIFCFGKRKGGALGVVHQTMNAAAMLSWPHCSPAWLRPQSLLPDQCRRTEMDKQKAERIRVLNDRFRRSGLGGDILITPGIQELGDEGMRETVRQVMTFDSFDHANDPYGEHDFGAFDHAGQRIFWKIDYYGPDKMSGSADPSNPDITARVLTIMLALEY